MKIVAEHLEGWAVKQSDQQKLDVFGRSAFNRFYYSAFLVTREMLGELKPSWKTTAHKAIPELLETGVKKPVIARLKLNARKDLITEGEKSEFLTKLQSSTSDLANLLREAYDVRLVADYEPETPILRDKKVLRLNNQKLSSARGWPDRASAYCKVIRCVWRDVGLA